MYRPAHRTWGWQATALAQRGNYIKSPLCFLVFLVLSYSLVLFLCWYVFKATSWNSVQDLFHVLLFSLTNVFIFGSFRCTKVSLEKLYSHIIRASQCTSNTEKIEQSILQKPYFFPFEDSCEEKHFYSRKVHETCETCIYCNITSRTSYFYLNRLIWQSVNHCWL